MKKITALLGILGVVSLISGCSSDTSSDVTSADISTADSSSSQVIHLDGNTSSAATTAKSSSSKGQSKPDTTIIHETVTIPQDKDNYKDPYFSSGIFCWSAECEANWNSSASQSSSSSIANIEINMSSSQPTPPLISGSQMIDQRDQKSYSIADIAGKKWMTTNINYATSNGYFCKTASSEDMCAKYGGYYTYAGALRACPDGWRLPTEAEVLALDAAVEHEWWQVGGRFKIADDKATDFGLEDEQGYIWIQVNGENSSFRVKNYGEDSPHELQSGSVAERAYNVRCIQE